MPEQEKTYVVYDRQGSDREGYTFTFSQGTEPINEIDKRLADPNQAEVAEVEVEILLDGLGQLTSGLSAATRQSFQTVARIDSEVLRARSEGINALSPEVFALGIAYQAALQSLQGGQSQG